MSFDVWRDQGKWLAYEGQGRFATREDVVTEIRRLQQADLDAALQGLRLAKAKVKEAQAALKYDVPFPMFIDARIKL